MARSRARSGVMKQASPLRARLASYWLVLEMSWGERDIHVHVVEYSAFVSLL